MLEWIIKEAQWKAGVFRDTKHVVAFDVGVVKSDVAIPEELRQALIEAVRPLEEVPEEQKDYHPGTDNKVIVKLANIKLTPEKPEYEGGSWHIEGQLNEHICATAIYYYDGENITESTLTFR
ncbi:hypothetical protein Aspvir_000040 [Aspergillus viridinutans]|uniref:DUF4246 domain-containing protein n=1 Tax=Aspergillus viridinutans TaxID=75553 RepID=A0A9P3BK56_ASPVI|nr:uncharacterized protein Aspvir_000040 [Aspergillus viridinutans]GIJ97934.1 hypothetical protein Aspvir_000040 [Aspergillus viridinutans]